jgi:hypothetical protein
MRDVVGRAAATRPTRFRRSHFANGLDRDRQRMYLPEIARAITSRWISEVPSKIV